MIVGLRDARRVEGVGLDDVRPGLEKRIVDRAHNARPRQGKEIVVALEVGRVIVQAALGRASILGLPQLVRLDHRAHCAVQNEDALGKQPLQNFRLVTFLVHISVQKCKNPFSLPPSGFRAKAALAAFVERPQARGQIGAIDGS